MSDTIKTYQDLINAKKELKIEISDAENELKNNKLFKFSSAIIEGKSLKEPLLDSVSSIDLKSILSSPLGNILNTFLLTNKFVRKYFVAFTIIKETVPYALNKLKDMIEQAELNTSKKPEERQL
jgi:hypothetical protein